MSRPRGFTLIEVLVALVIIAIGMAAVLTTLDSSANTVAYLREKTLAQWIALNQIAETRLAATSPAAGTRDGTLDYAGLHWHWRQTVTDGLAPGILQIEVDVQQADTPQGDQAPWIGSETGVFSNTVAPPQVASLYQEYPPSQPGSSFGLGAP
ncbi:MAG: type II secretion system minor pseudopilin GspI [Steroidobacteraceae bacterium]